MAVETSTSIAQWAESTFGPVDSLDRIVTRAQQEMTELREALARNASPAEIAHEAADIAIFLHRLVALVGHDLSAAVDEKPPTPLAAVGGRSGTASLVRMDCEYGGAVQPGMLVRTNGCGAGRRMTAPTML